MNTIHGINGPVVTVCGHTGLSMMEMVLVGNERLVGEVIGLTDDMTTIQVYENTTGLKVGEPITATGGPLCVTLGPGILDNIFDGIERPLGVIAERSAGMTVREEDKQFIAQVHSYSFVGLMLDWIKDDMRAEPELLVNKLALVIQGSISAALERFRTDRPSNP